MSASRPTPKAIENTLHEAGVDLEQVHHGDGIASCGGSTSALSPAATASGLGSRTPQFCPTADKLRETAT
jgi:hypothetical protein